MTIQILCLQFRDILPQEILVRKTIYYFHNYLFFENRSHENIQNKKHTGFNSFLILAIFNFK